MKTKNAIASIVAGQIAAILVGIILIMVGSRATVSAAEVTNIDTASEWAKETVAEAFDGGFLKKDIAQLMWTQERPVFPLDGRINIDRNLLAESANFQAPITRRDFAKMAVLWIINATGEYPIDLLKRMDQRMFGDSWYLGILLDLDVGYELDDRDQILVPHVSHNNDTLVLCAYQFGVINGTGYGLNYVNDEDYSSLLNTYFSPDDLITREQAATMVMRAVNFVNLVGKRADTPRTYSITSMPDGSLMQLNVQYDDEYKLNSEEVKSTVQAPSGTEDQGFADSAEISDWAKDAVNFCKANSIMNGIGDNNFSPKSNYTIEQAIVTFMNIEMK